MGRRQPLPEDMPDDAFRVAAMGIEALEQGLTLMERAAGMHESVANHEHRAHLAAGLRRDDAAEQAEACSDTADAIRRLIAARTEES